MKLKNRKTGEIVDVYKSQVLIHFDDGKKTRQFKSLDELCDEWEDYEEPECYWCINDLNGKPIQVECSHYACSEEFYEKSKETRKQFGNYFETKEEAEKAVEKLKAWKRLGITSDNCSYRYVGTNESRSGIDSFEYEIHTSFETLPNKKDLDLIFGCVE